MSEITIRDARYSELTEISKVMARAFFDDNIFGDFIHPNRKQFPDDMHLYYLRRARVNFWDWRWKWLVAVSRDDKGKEAIVGVAQWERMGDGGKRLELSPLDPRNLLMPLSSFTEKINARIWPNRAADPKNEDAIERCYVCIADLFSGRRAENWYLELLTVDPTFQGQNIGRRLVQWGLDQAEAEGVPAAVCSTWKKDEFYQKCGFDEQFGTAKQGEGNPLAGMNGANMYWRWPKKQE